jgi:hypothetical protein
MCDCNMSDFKGVVLTFTCARTCAHSGVGDIHWTLPGLWESRYASNMYVVYIHLCIYSLDVVWPEGVKLWFSMCMCVCVRAYMYIDVPWPGDVNALFECLFYILVCVYLYVYLCVYVSQNRCECTCKCI